METTKTQSRIAIPGDDQIPDASQPLLDTAEKMIGFVPNVLKVLSVSPEVLESFLTLQSNLSQVLDLKTRTAISLAVSEANGCHYCLSAHSFFASKGAKITDEEISLNRQGKSVNNKIAAAATFAAKVVARRGEVGVEDIEEVRKAGYTDKEIVEIIALSVQFTFTNFINNVAKTQIDFDIVAAPTKPLY
ncbi:hypothetical protein A4H97_14085 [Niastella yeongjuensis]|uniref:Carboxymuconolactone decarboxylase-like domain-containing protein n=1 Tax=Niastella yeongjuensis TaxID=354355 RepID=A0A1V9E4A4_9BACT|nr:peroxidase-related enzyme [Niastella yeongjuensis]OQP40745.1 hypothetical protein A4H97_14085 [Niastella yeongjuensis]SEP02935.1 uncharacterized peroxidase-related enzyme [Niastella yeongjuensis]